MFGGEWWIFAEVDESTSSYQLGFTIGSLFWPILMGVLLYQNVKAMWQPKANVVGHLSLALLSFAVVLLSLAGFLTRSLGIESVAMTLSLMVIAIIAIPLLPLSFILGIVGVIINYANKGKYEKGLRAAFTTMGLGTVVTLLFSVVLFTELASEMGSSGESEVFEEFNYSFTTPAGWSRHRALEHNNPAVTRGYRKLFPETALSVIAEKIEPNQRLTTERLSQVVIENLDEAGKILGEPVVGDTMFAGYPAKRIMAKVKVSGATFIYEGRALSHRGFIYQFLVWKEAKGSFDKFREEVDEMAAHFKLIDPERYALPDDFKQVTNYQSDRYHYSMNFPANLWGEWKGYEESISGSDIGVISANGGHLSVLVAEAPELEGVPIEVHASAWLKSWNVKFPGDTAKVIARYPVESTPASESAEAGSSFHKKEGVKAGLQPTRGQEELIILFERELEGKDYRYAFRVIKEKARSFLVAIYGFKKDDLPNEFLLEAVDSISVAPLPSSDRTKVVLKKHEVVSVSEFLNNMGLYYGRSNDLVAAHRFYRAAFRVSPEDPTYMDNVAWTFVEFEKPEQGLKFLDQHRNLMGKYAPLYITEARLHGLLDNGEETVKAYAKAFEFGHTNNRDFESYIYWMIDIDQHEEAIKVLAEAYKKKPSALYSRLKAEVYNDQEKYDEGLRFLKAARKEHPSDFDLAAEEIYLNYKAENYQESLRLGKALESKEPQSSRLKYLRGLNLAALKWYPKAKKAFEECLKINPKHSGANQWLEHVSGILGQGRNFEVKEKISPLEIPKEYLELNKPKEDEFKAYVGSKDYYVSAHVDRIHFEVGKPYKKTEVVRYHALTPQGVSTLSTLTETFHPLSERLYINHLKVYDKSGKHLADADVDAFYVLDPEVDSMATQERVLYMPVPGLQPGYTVELKFTRETNGTRSKMRYEKFYIGSSVPKFNRSVILGGDLEKVRHIETNGVQAEKNGDLMVWHLKQPPLYYWEPFSVMPEEYTPVVYLGSVEETWESEVKDYMERLSEHLKDDPELDAPSLAGAESVDTDSQSRVILTAAKVQNALTYKAIEFGDRGVIPNKAKDILSNKYGDCKDHSLLLYHFLKKQGITSYLALVDSYDPLEKRLPSLDQFNHMILYVPGFSNPMIDCTSKNYSCDLSPPPGLFGQEVLVLKEGSPEFVKIPSPTEEHSRITSNRQIMVGQGEALKVNEKLAFYGYQASRMRSYFKRLEKDRISERLQEIMVEEGHLVKVLNHKVIDEGVASRAPLTLEIEYLVKGAQHDLPEQLVMRIPAIWERKFLGMLEVPSRKTYFFLSYPLRFESQVTVNAEDSLMIPKGVSYDSPESDSVKSNLKWSREGNSLKLKFSGVRPTGLYKAAEWEPMQKSVALSLKSIEQSLAFKKVMETPSTGASSSSQIGSKTLALIP